MRKLILIGNCWLLCASRLWAQIDIEAISTDTVDILNVKQKNDDSRNNSIALWSTLFLPGSGHQAIGRSKSALGYICSDAVSIFCAIFFNGYSNRIIQNSRSFASVHASVASRVDDDLFWEAVGSFDSKADYLQTMDLMRESDKRFVEERFGWMWEDKSYREEFVSMQKSAKRMSTISSFFIGAMILTRVVAFIDLRSDLKNIRYRENAALRLDPFQPDITSAGVVLSAEF